MNLNKVSKSTLVTARNNLRRSIKNEPIPRRKAELEARLAEVQEALHRRFPQIK